MRHIKTKLLGSKGLWSCTIPESMSSKQYVFLVCSSCCLSLINANFVQPINFFLPFTHSFINFFTPFLQFCPLITPSPPSLLFHFFQVLVFSPLLLHQPLSTLRKSFCIKIFFLVDIVLVGVFVNWTHPYWRNASTKLLIGKSVEQLLD